MERIWGSASRSKFQSIQPTAHHLRSSRMSSERRSCLRRSGHQSGAVGGRPRGTVEGEAPRESTMTKLRPAAARRGRRSCTPKSAAGGGLSTAATQRGAARELWPLASEPRIDLVGSTSCACSATPPRYGRDLAEGRLRRRQPRGAFCRFSVFSPPYQCTATPDTQPAGVLSPHHRGAVPAQWPRR